MTTVTITTSQIIDDESGVEVESGTPDNNIASLPSAIDTALNNPTTGAIHNDGVILPAPNTTYFPTYAEKDAAVTISGATGAVNVLFSDAGGNALSGADSTLTTDNGTKIYLYTSPTNPLIVYGIAQSSPPPLAGGDITQGTLVFAIIMQETFDSSNNLTGGNLFIEQYQPIHNASTTATDDADIANLAGAKIFVSVTQDVTFSDFSNAPSGQDLWAGITPTGSISPVDILVTGINPNPSNPSAGDRVNVSSTGLGENSQGIGNNEGLRIDFVTNVTPNETSTTVKTANQLTYTQHQFGTGASWSPVQTNPTKAAVSALMVAYNDTDNSQQSGFFTQIANNSPGGTPDGTQSIVSIDSVQVFDSLVGGNLVFSATRGGTPNSNATFMPSGAVQVANMLNNYRVVFHTAAGAVFDRFTIINTTGTTTGATNRQFDVGNITLLDVGHATSSTALSVAFEDAGPTAALARSAITLTHDEGTFPSIGASDVPSTSLGPALQTQLTGVTNVSTDYQNDNPTNYFGQSSASVVNSAGTASGADYVNASTVYSLSIAPGGADSGLQTTDGTEVFLFLENGVAVGRIGSTAAAAATGAAAFAVAIDSNTGVLGVAEYASLQHGTADSNTESHEALSIKSGVLSAVVTETDGDGDQATASTDIGNALKILDGGPTATLALVAGATVAHDESPGVQGAPANDTIAPDSTLQPLLAGVGNQATGTADLALPSNTGPGGADDRFAANSGILSLTGFSTGPDEEGYTSGYTLSLPNGDGSGSDSGLRATYAPSTKILLHNESGVIVGREDDGTAAGGPAIFAIAIDPTTGEIDTEQYAAIYNSSPDSNGDISEAAKISPLVLSAVFTVTDGDKDVVTKSVDIGQQIQFLDDGPSITVNGTLVPTLTTTDPVAPATSSVSDNFGVDFTKIYGADGPGATPVSYALSLGSTSSGLTDSLSGQSVVLSVSADGSLVTGKTATSLAPVFTVGVDGTGKVTLTQLRAVKQGSGESPDTGETVPISGSNVVVLNAKATDGDGDFATATLDLTANLRFKDVGPDIAVNNITSATYSAGGSSTWTEDPNADGFKSLNITLNNYTIGSHTTVSPNISLGTDTTTDANGDYVFNGSITDDFNNAGTNQTVTFKLTFDPVTDNYKIDVTSPPTTIQTFDTSQGSLVAGGPNPVQTLTFSSGPSAGKTVVFFGVDPTAPRSAVSGGDALANPPQTPNDVEDLVYPGVTDLTASQIQAYLTPTDRISTLINSSTQMNVSTSGIGINNNNLDGATAGIQSTDESFVVNPQVPVDKVTVFIDNSVGGYTPATEDLEYSVYYIDGTVTAPQKVTAAMLTPVTTGVAAGGNSFNISDVVGGPQIDAIQLTMADGKVKIPVISFQINQVFNPQPLNMNLTATLTDGDGDTAQKPFSIALHA